MANIVGFVKGPLLFEEKDVQKNICNNNVSAKVSVLFRSG